jgi:hypothetical protein
MSEYIPYQPGPVPIRTNRELSRYLEDELHRISDVLPRKMDGALFSMSWSDTITIEQNITWVLLTDPTDTPDVAIPDTMWKASSGLIIAPYTGIYDCRASLFVEDISGAGNRNYTIGLGLHLNWVSGSPDYLVGDEQEDDKSLTLTISAMITANAGDSIDFLGYAYAEQFTQAASVRASIQVTRMN